MSANHVVEWLSENFWAIIALTMPLAFVFVAGELLLLLVPVALVVGYLLRPRTIWPLWLWTVAVIWIVNVFVAIADSRSWSDSGETVASFVFESLVLMAVLVLLPLWLGRLIARAINRNRSA